MRLHSARKGESAAESRLKPAMTGVDALADEQESM
jgi:hypothetical protein